MVQPAQQFSPAIQILDYYHYLFLQKLIVSIVNEHENICIAGLNHRAGYTTGLNLSAVHMLKFESLTVEKNQQFQI